MDETDDHWLGTLEPKPGLPAPIPIAEILAMVREALSSPAVVVDEDDVYPVVRLPGGSLKFFLDCGDLDYLEEADVADGRHAEYEDWQQEMGRWAGHFPLDDLTDEEKTALERLVGAPGYLRSRPEPRDVTPSPAPAAPTLAVPLPWVDPARLRLRAALLTTVGLTGRGVRR